MSLTIIGHSRADFAQCQQADVLKHLQMIFTDQQTVMTAAL